MKKSDLLKQELEEAGQLEERGERALAITAVLQKAFSPYKHYPILVGGAAVEIYTQGLYASGDIDYVLPTSDEVKAVMQELGFKREGRLFIHPQFQLIIEFPSGSLEEGETYQKMEYRGVPVRVISLEDLIIDRLNAFKWGRVSIEGQNILLMLDRYPDVSKKLQVKAKKHDVLDVLKKLIHLKEKIEKEKLDQKQATEFLENIIRKS